MWLASFTWEGEKTCFIPASRPFHTRKYRCSSPTCSMFSQYFKLSQWLPRNVLFYGFEFRTARVLMFDLDWCKIHGYKFPTLRRCTDMKKCGKWNRSAAWSQADILDLVNQTAGLLSVKRSTSDHVLSRSLLSFGPLKVVTAHPFISTILFSIAQSNWCYHFD